MGLNLWKVLAFLRDLLRYLPLPGNQSRLEFKPVLIRGADATADAQGSAINVLVFGSAHYQAWTNDATLKALIPDPANSVVCVFSGENADKFRKIVGMDRSA